MFGVWAHDVLLAMYLVVIVSYCCMARLPGAAGLAPAPVSGHMKLPRFWEAKQSAAAAVILFILYHV